MVEINVLLSCNVVNTDACSLHFSEMMHDKCILPAG